jgi:tetratricopeptide (TPR) repeat protein
LKVQSGFLNPFIRCMRTVPSLVTHAYPAARAMLLGIAACVVLAGCASAINLKTADDYFQAGLQAEQAGDYPRSREAFRRALINAKMGDVPPAFVSAVTYNLGRMTGYTCDFVQAEQLLLESLKLEQALPAPGPINITKRLAELARLYQDLQRHDESASFYARGVPELERLGILELDPIGYALYLDDYAKVLSQAGQAAKASEVAARAAGLRAKHPERRAGFVPLHFSSVCPRAS